MACSQMNSCLSASFFFGELLLALEIVTMMSLSAVSLITWSIAPFPTLRALANVPAPTFLPTVGDAVKAALEVKKSTGHSVLPTIPGIANLLSTVPGVVILPTYSGDVPTNLLELVYHRMAFFDF